MEAQQQKYHAAGHSALHNEVETVQNHPE